MNEKQREQIKGQIYADIAFCRQEIDTELQIGTKEAWDCIDKMFEIPYIKELTARDNALSIAAWLSDIRKQELKAGVRDSVDAHISCLEELEELYYRILFFLERFWFELPEEYLREMGEYVREYHISAYVIEGILKTSRIKPKEAILKKLKEDSII